MKLFFLLLTASLCSFSLASYAIPPNDGSTAFIDSLRSNAANCSALGIMVHKSQVPAMRSNAVTANCILQNQSDYLNSPTLSSYNYLPIEAV